MIWFSGICTIARFTTKYIAMLEKARAFVERGSEPEYVVGHFNQGAQSPMTDTPSSSEEQSSKNIANKKTKLNKKTIIR